MITTAWFLFLKACLNHAGSPLSRRPITIEQLLTVWCRGL
jgi:hypothetical protein